MEQRVQELNRLDKGVSAAVANSTKRHIAWLDKEIAQLEEEYQEALQSSSSLAQRAALYRTMPGVGPLTDAILVAHLPELGHWDSKALTSLVGLAPWSRDSGQKRGQRAIRGGRGIVRKALYLCACSVIQVNGELRRFYQNLRQRGKPGNLALVAVMRKLLLQLNALARRQTPWVMQPGQRYLLLNLAKTLTPNHGYCSGSISGWARRPSLYSGLPRPRRIRSAAPRSDSEVIVPYNRDTRSLSFVGKS